MGNNTSVRAALFGFATLFVGGAMLTFASYSNAKFDEAAATAHGVQATEVVIAPARIDVIGKRTPRTAGVVPAGQASS